MHKQAIKSNENSLVVVSMDQNMTAMHVYDLDAVEYIEVDESFANRTDVEKARDYVGTGQVICTYCIDQVLFVGTVL